MRKLLDVYNLAEHTRVSFLNGDGFTFDPETLAPATEGYAVSLRGYEYRSSYAPSHAAIRAWIVDRLEVARMLKLDPDTRVYVGGWVDKGFFYLDVTVVVKGYARAYALAQEHKQLAFYDLTDKRTIEVDLATAST